MSDEEARANVAHFIALVRDPKGFLHQAIPGPEIGHDDLRFALSLVLDTYADATSPRGRAERVRAANEVLQEEAKSSPETRDLALDEKSGAALAAQLAPRITRLRSAIDSIPLPPVTDCTFEEYDAREPPERGGMLAFDAVLADELRTIGPTGTAAAELIADVAPKRWAKRKERPPHETWRLWTPLDDAGAQATPLAIRNMLIAIWRDEVLPRLRREAAKPPALVRAVHVEATLFHSRGPKYDAGSASLTFEGRRIADRVGASFDLDVIQKGLGLLGSVASHELFHWEVTQGHEQHLLGVARPHVLEVEGGWVALAERLGLKPSKHAANLRSIAVAQASFRFSFPDGSTGNMLVLNERPAAGHRRAHVRIELGTVLMPGYVEAPGLPDRERKLVPVLRERVPLYGRPREHGEQRTMSLVLMAELRDRARELVDEGGALISRDMFVGMADRSGVPRSILRPVVEHWLAGDTHAPPFIKRVASDRYTLSDVHAAERAFLEDGGHREALGSAGGQRSAKSRRARLGRVTRPNRSRK